MSDDTFCVFVILTCMTSLAVAGPGQIVVAVFGLSLALLAHFVPEEADPGNSGDPDQRGVERQRHVG